MDENKTYWSEDEWRKNNWRCSHGWLRGEQCEICNAPKREWVGLTPEDLALVLVAIEHYFKERNT